MTAELETSSWGAKTAVTALPPEEPASLSQWAGFLIVVPNQRGSPRTRDAVK